MIKTILLFLLAINISLAYTQEESVELEIVSWNVFLRPLLSDNQLGRVDSIGVYLMRTDADVLVLQELFHRKTRKQLIKTLSKKYPEHTHVGPTSFFGISSGVMIFSKHQIIDESHLSFKKSKGIDGIAKKGGVAAIINFFGKKIKIIGTHLQAGGGDKGDRVRRFQFKRLTNLFVNKKVDATIYAGDFNTKQNSEEFDILLHALDCENDELTGKRKNTANFSDHDLFEAEGTPEWIDFILLTKESKGFYSKTFIDAPFCLIDGTSSRISDHNPIRSVISFKRQ